ncbi:Sensory box/GGDEF family protein [Pseudoalteromonas carrageenovora]|uniref:Diguanylate phosphodiesterase n=3 Tax=Pseudoalteromonas carrageenovora TaxID=227 RepID=A0A2K4XEZ8_PSEVC|nr:Sensory box/GGDEF family protein [Pseudoalteromonas carrageenovora]SOU42899.1 Diguanylate phosphodiesterase [Pseudoalteromonas carrageenovora IAM 12662]
MYMSKMVFLIIIVVLFCIGSASASQNYAQQLQRLSTDEGLSQSYVTRSLQDDIGFVWIATAQGLNRYDGYQVTAFDGDYDLDKQYIYDLFETSTGNIIVSTDVTGAYLVNPNTLKTEKIYSGQLDDKTNTYSPISAVAQLNEQSYFAIDEQILTYNHSTKKLTPIAALTNKDDYIRALAFYKNTLYVGTNNGIYTLDIKSKKLQTLSLHKHENVTADNNNIKLLTLDAELGLMVGTVEGLYLLAFDKNKNINPDQVNTLVADYNIWDYSKTDAGEFIATQSGLFQYFRHTGNIEFILSFDESKFNITENTINDVMIDKSGLLWLASRTQGVLTWATQTKRFKNITLPNSNIINKIVQDENILWVGTDNGIAKYNLNTQQVKTFLESTDSKAVYGEYAVFDIFPANIKGGQYLWLARYHGLELFNKVTGEKESGHELITSDLINTNLFGFAQIAPDTFAYISNSGFYIYNGKTGENRPIRGLEEKTKPIDAYTFHAPLNAYPEELILSTKNKLYRYHEKTETLTTIFQSNNKNNNLFNTVENFYLDTKRNLLWLATTQEGLIALDTKTYERKHTFNIKNALETNSIYMLLADNNRNLWASSENGLYQLNLDTQNITSYTVKDGLNNNKFSAISGVILNNKHIAFGSYHGILQFDPTDFNSTDQSTHTNLEITDINLLSKNLTYYPNKYKYKPLKLAYDDVGLTVKFSNFDYINKESTRYKVVLSGANPLIYDELKTNQVFFTKLQPGDYSLTVSVVNQNDTSIGEQRSLNFSVAYAPWQSPLAYALYLIGIFLIFFLLFWQYRNRQVAIESAQRETIHSQKQTELALKNNKSGVWNYRFSDHTVNTQRGSELGYFNLPERLSIERYFLLIHPDDRRRVEAQWYAYIKQNKQQHWQSTYRLKHKEGHWLWYQDLGQIMYKEHTSEAQYVSGIYTNITEQRANEQQANILGEAFSQITDWLLILDDRLMPFSANNSFIDTFSNEHHSTKLSLKLIINAIGKAKCREFAANFKALKAKQNWRTNTHIKTAKNSQHPVHLSVTAVAKESNTVSYYVVVISDLTEQKRAETELRYLANFDPLTRLPNRSLMYKNIEQAIVKVQKSNNQCALLFIDLDKFKPVNDSFGHAVGDKLLCDITRRVSAMLGDNAALGRQSGDEFLVLIENIDSIESLNNTVKTISHELANKVSIEDFSINISASIGVALYPNDANSTDTLIRNADVAMMQAKQAGRNGFKFFNEKMNEQIKQKLILENDLKDATKENLLFNHYQPIVDLHAKTINGVELLMRWENKGQFISPAVFIPVAEETGLIEKLTEQALKRALTDLAPLLNNNPLFYISLNLSPKHILKIHIASRLVAILSAHNINPKQLRLEITESTLLEDKQKASKQLHKLKTAGFKLLLDDFGTGYSSLTYLSQFPINVIKIDQSFVQSIGLDKNNESIIKTIYSLADNLGLYCIAEGVETHEQIIFLSALGCHVLQGYYFAKPMTAQDLCNGKTFEEITNLL